MSRNVTTLIFLINLLLLFIYKVGGESVEDAKLLSLLCQSKTDSCSECLNYHSKCSWCFDMEFLSDRCDLVENLSEKGCSEVYSGKKCTLKIVNDLEFRDVTDTVKNAIQIKPQKVKLQLRPGDSKIIKLKYQIAKNYPLDLYYLMDASYSMKDDLETVATLGDQLTISLSNLTKHFRIGFGTFSDKVLMPFARMDNTSLTNPCSGTTANFCSPGFGFKHNFKLNQNIQQFIQQIHKAVEVITASLDNAEGALDALLQVLVCGKEIGWKNDSRKLILLLTNSLLHFAGDGKLGGVAKPSDGVCHLNDEGFYTAWNSLDYPSLEQIYRKLKRHKTNVIFAVASEVLEYYKKLNNLIPNYSYVTLLHSDSSNIVNVIKKGYEDVMSVVQFQDNSTNPIELIYYSNCNKPFFNYLNQTNSCYGIKEGEMVEFDLKITLKNCPDDKTIWNQTILIDESHLETDSLIIQIEMLCDCNCQDSKFNDSICNFHGSIECGICRCDSGWSGKNCECDYSNFESNRMLENNCREITDNMTSVMCYGNGDCICGKCECDSFHTGKYCECRHCEKINGLECGGPFKGLCSCGSCLCMPGYTGSNCLCPLDKEICKAPGDFNECSGHGICHCGKCECDSIPFKFSGNYCEKCSTCAGLCHLYENCIKCKIQNSCKADECDFNVITSIEFAEQIEDSSNTCIVQVDKEFCTFWTYEYIINKNNTVKIRILNQNCKAAHGTIYLGIGAFCLVVFLGLIAIISFKVIRDKRDAREFAKYQKSLQCTKFEENAHYKSPKTEYFMPKEAKFN